MTEYKSTLIYLIIVISIVVFLLLLTKFTHNWLAKKAQRKYPDEEPSTIHLVKKILNTLWIILGICAISFIFIGEDKYDVAKHNFNIILYLGFVLVFTIIGASIVETIFTRLIKKTILSGGDPTSYKFLRYLVVFLVYFFGAIVATLAFPSLRGVAQTALGGAGVITVVLGVASQEALANLVGGIFIIFFKPFKVGDVIKITETLVGTVMDITLRHTIIKNYQNKMIVIPNAIINKEKVTNYDLEDKKICQWIEIGISYDSDIDTAKRIIQEECEAHPNLLDNRTYEETTQNIPKVLVRVIDLGESAVTIRAWAWALDFSSAFVMKCELYESIKKRFDKEGIEIPFPHRTIVFKDKETTNVPVQ